VTILVAGDAMLDRYWHGEVARISPEAPVPVLKVTREEQRLGAAANVAANLIAMGVPAVSCYSRSFDYDQNAVVKIRAIGKNHQMLRIDFDRPQEPIGGLPDVEASIVIFSDYGKGALANIQELINDAKLRAMTVLVDPKGSDYRKYRGADVVKPNQDELRLMMGGWESEDQLFDKLKRLQEESQIPNILLTRASEGISFLAGDGSLLHIHPQAKEVFDVTGAGDTAIAAFGAALHRGSSMAESAQVANRAAGIAVGHFGTYQVTEGELFGH
jgi:D-glycero-beta-D-manno-heptose-7-phosphate kinase